MLVTRPATAGMPRVAYHKIWWVAQLLRPTCISAGLLPLPSVSPPGRAPHLLARAAWRRPFSVLSSPEVSHAEQPRRCDPLRP